MYGKGVAIVVVYATHVVSEVPLARETISWDGTFASVVCAKIGLITVTVHGMCLPFMAQETRSRREPGILASLSLAPVWLEVGVDKFAVVEKLDHMIS